MDKDDPLRFRVEVLFSPGTTMEQPYRTPPKWMSEVEDEEEDGEEGASASNMAYAAPLKLAARLSAQEGASAQPWRAARRWGSSLTPCSQ